MLKRITSEIRLAIVTGVMVVYGWLLRWTTSRSFDPPQTFYEPLDKHRAVIFALWHGEHFLAPFLMRPGDRLAALVTTHRDGEVVARAGRYFGLSFIRGSGDHGREFRRKKAVQAFAQMLRCLRDGTSVVLTADVPKVSRVAGLGIVTLAKHSQCPIVPVAIVTRRRIRLSNWDRTCISLPFGRMLVARDGEIMVPPDADEAALEAARQRVQTSLDEVTRRAYARVDA